MLKATNIHKSYGGLKVLNGIDLSIEPKEIVSIVGPSGAGKSTLLHLLGTLDRPDTGSIVLNDVDLKTLSGKELAKFRNENIGFVFQFHNLLPEFSAMENVCIPGWMNKGQTEAETENNARKLLDKLGLSHRLNHKPSELSGGEQQRAAVARALINQPAIILADEPSGNLDTHNAEDLHDLFFTLRKEFGQTFVIVTHNEKLADKADRKWEMADGKILNNAYEHE